MYKSYRLMLRKVILSSLSINSFTSAIRTGLKYQGSEKITVGGGEEIWLFINKQLVIEIVDDRLAASTTCRMVDLSSAKGWLNFFYL